MGTLLQQQAAASRPARVLVAEGDRVSLTHLQGLLSKSGYDVVTANDGLQALELLQSESAPSLAVLDWIMPGMNGIEICRRMQNGNHRRSSYLILLTAWNQRNDRVAGLEAGADDCLFKPVDVRELRIRLQIGAQIVLERALRESEARFRSAFAGAGIGMAVVNAEGEFLQINSAFCDFLAYGPEELTGLTVQSVSYSGDFPPTRDLLHRVCHAGKHSGEFERRFVTKSGLTTWGLLTVSLVQAEAGQAADFLLQVQDISQRKQAEEALRRSEALFRAITDSARDLILVLDTDHRWAYVSPASFPLLGYEPDELLGRDAWEGVHPDDRELVAASARQVFDGKPGPLIRFRIQHKDGTWRHLESQASLMRSPDGGIEGRVAVARVIDDRIQAEQELRVAHAETELFLQCIPSILIGLDPQGRITRWNLTAANIFGLEKEKVLGRTIGDCGIQWLHPEMGTEIASWLATMTSRRCEDLPYERDGKIQFLGLNVQRIPAEHGQNAGFIITGADVTQRKTLEEQLRQAQKLEAIGQLAAGIAHEINTPTQYVGDNIRFLKDSWESSSGFVEFCGVVFQEASHGPLAPESLQKFCQLYEKCDFDYLAKEIPRALEQSLEGLERVAKIVRGMKEFSHPGSEEKRAVDINRAIDTTITVARNEWKYSAEMVTQYDHSLPLVPCLVGEFNQVVLNLIINAAHAITSAVGEDTGRKGTITIATRTHEGWAEISIADTGVGIPESIRSRIFEPFFTTKGIGKGTGQGLALAHSVIVNRHQGQIWFESEPGRGTTFFIRLPLETGTAVT
jgi:PAS domain S-box-containing protein